MFGEKNISKKLNLLYYLEVFESESTLLQLMEFLSVSRSTLKKYISEINEITTDYDISIKKGYLFLQSDHRENGMVIAKKIIADSVNVHLLTNIMHKPYSLPQLADRLFITKSTVLYKIEQINHYFEEHQWDIKIELDTTYKIKGDECLIRNFFKIMLLEIDYHPIYKNNQLIFSEMRQYLENHYPDIKSWNESLKIDTYTFVSLIRTAQGFYLYPSIESIPEELFVEIEYAYYKLSKKIPFIEFIQSKFNITMNLLFFANIMPVNHLNEILYLRGEITIKEELETKVGNVLREYVKKFKIGLSQKQLEAYTLLVTSQIILMTPFNQILLRDYEIHYEHLKKISSKKIDFLFETMKKWSVIPYDVDSLYYEILIYIIVTVKEIRKDFFSINKINHLNILIYSSQNIIYSEVIEYILVDKYAANYDLRIDHKNIFYDHYNIKDYDIIISDVFIEAFEGKYLFLTMTPSKDFWSTFELLINKATKKD